MSKIMSGASESYKSIRDNARLSYYAIDSNMPMTDYTKRYPKEHIMDCAQYPTVGLLARQQNKTNEYPKFYKEHVRELQMSDEFRDVDEGFRNKFKTLYNKTGKVRRQLIKKESIVLDDVKPIQKNFQRTLIKLFGKLM